MSMADSYMPDNYKNMVELFTFNSIERWWIMTSRYWCSLSLQNYIDVSYYCIWIICFYKDISYYFISSRTVVYLSIQSLVLSSIHTCLLLFSHHVTYVSTLWISFLSISVMLILQHNGFLCYHYSSWIKDKRKNNSKKKKKNICEQKFKRNERLKERYKDSKKKKVKAAKVFTYHSISVGSVHPY